ncbi:hypothetical protein H4S08_000173 [Coemansia sp. RSA 1365]|nr:hypothetical protein H4S08_000173 [Coemansia sp. RSA 1365]
MLRLAPAARAFRANASRIRIVNANDVHIKHVHFQRRGVSSIKVVTSSNRVNATPAGESESAPKKAASFGPNVTKSADTEIPGPVAEQSLGGDLTSALFNTNEGYLRDSHWTTSYQGMAAEPFEQRISDILMAPVVESEVEIKPDGLLYLPEIKYRRILNRAFGPGGWGLVPRGAHSVSGRTLSREYALVCLGRFISQARGEQDYFDESGLATATEGCKSNALVRCCKDLGIASELWDPSYISKFKEKHCVDEWVTHAVRGNKKRMWRLKTRQWEYPWKK